MANVNILNTPSQSYTYKVSPVYNGLPFTVNSSRKNRNNFKYVADVYVNGTKITTLKHNKDISNQSFGIFDIGRIVENYITTNTSNITTPIFTPNENSYREYNVKFGCEYERFLNYTSVSQFSPTTSTIGFGGIPHDLRIGDYVTLQNSSNPYYNGVWKVLSVSTNFAQIDLPYVGNSKGIAIECETFFDNAFVDGYVGFAIPDTRPTRINVGDRVVVKQDVGATILGYDGEWLVTSITTQVIGGNTYNIIKVDCPFIGNTPVNGGMIYSISKYNWKDLVTSSLEYTFDGGLQYKEYVSYNPTIFSTNVSNKGRFLTNSPKKLKIRKGELATLSFLHTSIIGGQSRYLGIFTYDSNSNLINSELVIIPNLLLPYFRLDVATGTHQLDQLVGFNVSNSSYYEVYLTNSGGTRTSEIIRYEIDNKCYRYSQKRLKWKNRLGGWDYYTFNLRSDITTDIERSNFNKYRKSLNTSNKLTYSIGDRGLTTFNVKAIDSERIQSNWLTNDEAKWLEELFTSPDVYIMDGFDEIPVVIKNNSFVLGEKENKGLITYNIDIQYAYNKVIQRN